jgi:hypothetical protein
LFHEEDVGAGWEGWREDKKLVADLQPKGGQKGGEARNISDTKLCRESHLIERESEAKQS